VSWDTIVLLAAAGFVAGVVNGVAGGGSLVSFPALLAAGHGALVANVTSTVGIWPGYAGGVAGYRHVLGDQRDRVRRLAPTCVVGGLAGAALLLLTPSRFFATIAPYLILAACALFAVQPRVSRALARRSAARVADGGNAPAGVADAGPRSAIGLHACILLASMYGAYFGAGLGVILLAVLALLLESDLQRANGLRGVLALVINSVGVVVFAIAADVVWSAAAVLAVTSLVGGYTGAHLAQRLPERVFRLAVILLGLAASARLLV
jgi:uncharacterized membrane protein YfcA